MSPLAGNGANVLELQTSIACPHAIVLRYGLSLKGLDKDRCILGFGNGDGIALTADNEALSTAARSPIAPGCRHEPTESSTDV